MAGIDEMDGEYRHASAPRDLTGLRMMRKAPLLEEAWRYWTSLRRGAELPLRSALDPNAMKLLLGHAMILDQVRHGAVRVRLGGHVMQDLMGMEVRGLPIRAFFDLTDRTRVTDLFGQVFETPSTLELDLISEGPEGIVTARMLVLPLQDAAGAVTKALTVMVCDRHVRDAPRRFSLTNATAVPLADRPRARTPERRRTDVPALPVEIEADGSVAGFAEGHVPFETRPSPVPWLRVVK